MLNLAQHVCSMSLGVGMFFESLSQQRRWVYLGLLAVLGLGTYWYAFSPGLPVLWGPSAYAEEIVAGRELFEREWTPNDPLAHGDGLGPVFNARSCAACHFQGGLGGGGELQHNAVGFEITPRTSSGEFHTGTIHNFSVKPEQRESLGQVRKLFPVVRGSSTRSGDPHCPIVTTIPDFDPVRTESVQTTALFGAGWLDLISDKAIRHNQQSRMRNDAFRELAGDFNAIPVGRLRVLADGRLGRFGWKSQSATLSEFVAAACANELGLGTPTSEQARPLNAPTLSSQPDLDAKQFRELVAFVKTLPRPVEVVPEDEKERAAAIRGKELFTSVGCAACHTPTLGGVEGVYSDFLLYILEDPTKNGGAGGYGGDPTPTPSTPPRPDHEAKPGEWKTPPLWGVADSAPYLHDGSARTLTDAIARHRGDARIVLEAYQKLPTTDQAAVLAFLKTLKAPPEALPLRDPAITKLSR
jgi:CxxC motif-containing protein (DUF1111 family)